jgi:hypothetical protein
VARKARRRSLPLCTHLIAGLPGEEREHVMQTLQQVLDVGVDGLKLHPLHVVKGTALANEWRRGDYQALSLPHYVRIAADLVQATPKNIVFHRLTGTAAPEVLLAPQWCAKKWAVLNAIERELHRRQGAAAPANQEKPTWNWSVPPVTCRP